MFGHFLDFALDGSLEALDSVKILSRGAPTISRPGKPYSEICFFRDFVDLPNPRFSSMTILLYAQGGICQQVNGHASTYICLHILI